MIYNKMDRDITVYIYIYMPSSYEYPLEGKSQPQSKN